MTTIETITSESAAWVVSSDNESFMRGTAREKIETALDDGDLRPGIVVSFNKLAVWEGASGTLAVLQNDGSGWESIQASLAWRYLGLRVLVHAFVTDARRARKVRATLTSAALCFTHALVTDVTDVAEWCGAVIAESETNGALGQKTLNPFGAFASRLVQIYLGNEIDRQVVNGLGDYSELFKYWGQGERLADVLERICDYHLARTSDPTDEEYPEFIEHPYKLFAVDILAFKRCLELVGLESPSVGHPLMALPLAKPPMGVTATDDLLARATGKVLASCPSRIPVSRDS